MPRRRSAAAATALAIIATLIVAAPTSPAGAAVTSITVNTPRVAEAPDFASEQFADPWDFANAEDHATTPNARMSDLSNPTIAGGRFTADAVVSPNADGRLWMLDSWDDDGLPWGRDGALHPIDAARFRRLSLRMWTPNTGDLGTVVFSTCGRIVPECLGQRQFALVPGWHTYDIEIGNDVPWFGGTWAGFPRGIAITPSVIGGRIAIDWIRLYEPTGAAPVIQVADNSPATPAQVYWDLDANLANNTPDNPDWGYVGAANGGAVTFPSDRFPPGTYRFYAVDDGQTSAAGAPLTIDARPRPLVIEPDIRGGADYATVVRGDPWDFDQPTDVAGFWNASGSVAGGSLTGVNTPTAPNFQINDPGILLPSGPIDATRFHRLVVGVAYDGAFSLDDAPGGGMNARLAWHLPGNPANDATDDIVVYPGYQEIAIDLNTWPPGAVNDGGNGLGWLGRTVDRVRFDPHEDRAARGFRLDFVRLAEDDTGIDGFDITFRDDAWEPGTTATVYVDRDRSGFDGTAVATVAVQQGVNTVRWTPGRDSYGTPWWVYVVMTDPGGTQSRAYSSGPVRVLGSSVPSTPSRFVPITPTRILDTRVGNGTLFADAIAPNGSVELQVTGRAGVPADATAVVMNVTATETGGPGYVTAWPTGYSQPLASNLNAERRRQTIPNLVTVPIGAGGKVSLFTQSGSHLVADVAGYYVPAATATDGRFAALPPARLLDTRDGNGGTLGPVPDEGTISLQVTGRGGVPASGVGAVALNVTATESTGPGFVTVWPSGLGLPLASNLNLNRAGQTIANQVIVPVGPDGRVQLYAQRASHLVVDVAGWFTDAGAPPSSSGLFVPLNPNRILDTRTGNGSAGYVAPARSITVQTGGRAGVPPNAAGAVLNTTATEAFLPGFVTVWPADRGMPLASNLNIERGGQTIPNHTTATLSGSGAVSLFTQGGTHLVSDVFGYYTG